MDKIYSLFRFANHEIGYVFGRFGVELLGCILIAFLVAFIIIQVTKKRNHEIGFTNWVKVSFMYGIIAAVIFLGVVIILTIRVNGLYYFFADALSWTWYCGYLLMIPEMVLIIGLVAVYVVLDKQIHKSINY